MVGSWLGDELFSKFASDTQDILIILSEQITIFICTFALEIFWEQKTHTKIEVWRMTY